MPSGEFRQVSSEDSRCEALAESLSAYVDGALAETLRHDVEAHVRACTTCAAELARLEKLCAELRDLVAVEPPSLVWDKVRDAAAGPTAGVEHSRLSRAAAILAQIALFLFDGDLSRRCRVEGTWRDPAGSVHGVIAIAVALLLGLLPRFLGVATPLAPLAITLVFLWLASTRLEGRLSSTGLVATTLAGAAAPTAIELVRALHGFVEAPLALPAALAALATAQATLYPRLRPEVLGRFRVRCAVRSSALVLLAGAMARPDLVGPLAAVPPVAGAVGGALAAWVVARRRHAA